MDIFESVDLGHTVKVRYAPIIWEPLQNTGERFVTLIAFQPISMPSCDDYSARCKPEVLISVRKQTLPLITGGAKSGLAASMLETARDFIAEQLEHGISLEDIELPFEGFFRGSTRVAVGSSKESVLSTAIATCTVLSDGPDSWRDDERADETVSASTRSFIRLVKGPFVAKDPTRKDRFKHRVDLHNGPTVSLDYAYRHWMIQMTSLPGSVQQTSIVQRESESKLLQLEAIREEFKDNPVQTQLIVNRNTVFEKRRSSELVQLRDDALARVKYFAKRSDTQVVIAENADEGQGLLEATN
jgi:hypothetical protein